MHNNALLNGITKLLIIIFWIGIFFGFLYVPMVFQFWKNDKSLNVATWTDMLDEDMIKRFEKETGIVINLSYFDNNDELLVKIRETKGQGYDLIIPSDHTVQLLAHDGLLQPLDKSKITVWDRVNPRLLGAYFDPENIYSIPYYWGIYGIGVNKDYFHGIMPEASWNLIFKPLNPFAKISMLDNPREAILLTAFALFGTIENLDNKQLEAVKQRLIEQKKWVEAYTEYRADYLLLSTTCPVVVSTSAYMFRLMGVQKNVEFIIPTEGTFTVTDNWVIPTASNHQELVYQFINFLYQPDVIEHHFNVFTFIPATIDIETLLVDYPSIYEAHTNQQTQLLYFKNVLSKTILNDIWIALKA